MDDGQSSSAPIGTPPSPSRRRPRKYRSLKDVINAANYVVLEDDDYNDTVCDQCGSGDRDHQLLLCDKCDRAYHMLCLRPIVVRVPIGPWYCPACSDHPPPIKSFTQTKIFDFFKIKKCTASSLKRISPQDSRRRRRRIVHHKRRRRLLPFTPSEDTGRRLEQMGSLASALTSLNMEYSDDLTYSFDMAPRWANLAEYEEGGMQVLSKEDTETLELCRAMLKRGECPPLLVIFDSCEGYTVEADGPIKDMTLITEYTGDVDYIKNREQDDCDSMMTLLLASNPSKSLVICPDKRGNIARFINGINNYTPEAKKKQNLKCVRYSVNGECRVLLVATRDIAKGERLYYDYNGFAKILKMKNYIYEPEFNKLKDLVIDGNPGKNQLKLENWIKVEVEALDEGIWIHGSGKPSTAVCQHVDPSRTFCPFTMSIVIHNGRNLKLFEGVCCPFHLSHKSMKEFVNS